MITELFIEEFSDLLEIPRSAVTDDFSMVQDTSWNSLAFIGTIALVDKHFDIVLDVENLKKINTFSELKSLLISKR